MGRGVKSILNKKTAENQRFTKQIVELEGVSRTFS